MASLADAAVQEAINTIAEFYRQLKVTHIFTDEQCFELTKTFLIEMLRKGAPGAEHT